jgi:hypothetical protein
LVVFISEEQIKENDESDKSNSVADNFWVLMRLHVLCQLIEPTQLSA